LRALLALRTAKADVALRPLFAGLALRPRIAFRERERFLSVGDI
jgi:hypothetical protein